MAGNEWINGYLEAILSTGGTATVDEQQRPVAPRETGHFNPTKPAPYMDQVVATRNTRERSSRLENMCWRIWHLARKKKQLEGEELQRLANRRWEREQGRRDATEDMSEELSEGEKGDGIGEMIQIEMPKK
ncbi:putative sucrose-phosphate synthase 3 [Sesbania bispinosa]|nr:putative sucrose-phosphate synthase 3 [Sesbania bispinosa]